MARERSVSNGHKQLSESVGNNSENNITCMTTSPRLGSPRGARVTSVGHKVERGFFPRKKSTELDNSGSNNNNAAWESGSSHEPKEIGKVSSGSSSDDLRKTMFMIKSCPDNNKGILSYLSSPRRSSFISNTAPPVIPPLKLSQSASLTKVDPNVNIHQPTYLKKTDSNNDSCSSGDDTVGSDEDHKKDDNGITAIIKHISCSPEGVTGEDEADVVEYAEESPSTLKRAGKAVNMHLKNVTRSRTNSYVRDDELQSTDGDDEGIRSVLAVHEVLDNDIKTAQSLLDDKMVLLRALFDVPEYGEYKDVALWVSTIFLAHEKAVHAIQWAIKQEVESAESETALFRADSMPCALVANFLRSLGKVYLQKVVGPHILKMYQTKKSYEIDINRAGYAKSNASRLKKFARSLLKAVFNSVSACPKVIRDFLHHMCVAIKTKYPEEVALKTVSSFFFLRFVCVGILYPNLCGILESIQKPSPQAARGLILAGKILQNIANGVVDIDCSEAHMCKIQKVLVNNAVPMQHFMEKLCQKQGDGPMDVGGACFPTPMQYKTAVHDLQKYITAQIALIPKIRPEPVAETDPIMRLLKLRRALQSYSYTWRNPITNPSLHSSCKTSLCNSTTCKSSLCNSSVSSSYPTPGSVASSAGSDTVSLHSVGSQDII